MKIFLSLLIITWSLSISQGTQPNIILVFVDDMGYGDAGVYGQTLFTTPNLDKMAADGLLFTDFYAASAVCAPSRASLVQGLHQGHSRIRDNVPFELIPEDVSIGEVMKFGGYQTAWIGKWGVGRDAPWDDPNKNGFDHFLGYTNNGHAHNCYPSYLAYNGDTINIGNVLYEKWLDAPDYGEGIAEVRVNYAPFVLRDSAVAFIKRASQNAAPFFLVYSLNIPHANNEWDEQEQATHGMEVPDFGEFADKNWPDGEKGYAQMMRYIDNDVGMYMDLLDSLGIAGKTLMMFTSDNGTHSEGGHTPEFFNSSGDLRGFKRDVWDGGIRMPTIAWWPGVIEAGRVTDLNGYSPDFLPTFAELAGVSRPTNIDGISFAPTLLNSGMQTLHDYLYIQYKDKIGVRQGDWKYVYNGNNEYLYNLASDPDESNDVSGDNPELFNEMRAYDDIENTEPLVVEWDPQRVPIPEWQSTSVLKPGKSTAEPGYIKSHFRRSSPNNPTGTGYNVQGKKNRLMGEGIYLKVGDQNN